MSSLEVSFIPWREWPPAVWSRAECYRNTRMECATARETGPGRDLHTCSYDILRGQQLDLALCNRGDGIRTGPCMGISIQQSGTRQTSGKRTPRARRLARSCVPSPSREGLRVWPRHPNIVLASNALYPQFRSLLLPLNLHLASTGHFLLSIPTPLFPLSSSRADYLARIAPAPTCLVRQPHSPLVRNYSQAGAPRNLPRAPSARRLQSPQANCTA